MEEDEAMDPTEVYVGTKIIRARKMEENHFRITHGRPVVQDNCEGYLVIYADGYESWSPKDTFENSYRLVTSKEKEMLEPEKELDHDTTTEPPRNTLHSDAGVEFD